MGLTIDDLKPKNFKVNIKGVELECRPLRVSHALTIAKIGNIFQDANNASRDKVKQAEEDMDGVIAELIPDLKDIQLDMASVIDLIQQMMDTIEPSDNADLKNEGVKFDNDPKA